MKSLYVAVSLMTLACGLSAAYADNIGVEDAIKSRPELSSFYQALVDTGVIHELKADSSYTVFAPTNEAFASISKAKYPCFYMAECKAQVAVIIRNHIIPGKIFIADAAQQLGTIFSIGDHSITIGEPFKNDYAVEGNNILNTSKFDGGILYKIDGVIITPFDAAALQRATYNADAAPKEVTTVTRKTIPDPACGKAGCSDAVTETTTITRTIETTN